MGSMMYGGVPEKAPTFGQDFNYAVWNPGTEISFHNVPWNNDYRDIVRFGETVTLDEYLTTVQGDVTFAFSSYAKAYEAVRVGLPFNYCYRFNYLRVHNPAMPVGYDSSGGDTPRTFYYFIKDIKFLAPETTELVVQLDVWQTFANHVEFGNCYMERGHIGVANTQQFQDFGRTNLTVPEGFDVGNEYFIDRVVEHKLADNGPSDPEHLNPPENSYHVLVWSATSLSFGNYGTITAPNLDTATGSGFENLPNGLELLWFTDIAEYGKLMRGLKSTPWISQGIVSVMAVPPFDVDADYYEELTVELGPGRSASFRRLMDSAAAIANQLIVMAENWRDDVELGYRYRHLKKFLTFPYMVVELTTYMGTPLVLKPENMPESDLKVLSMAHYALPGPRLAFIPWRYNASPGYADDAWDELSTDHDHAEFLDMATGITNFPTFSVVNDQYRNYLASNANSIAYQYNQADWGQQRALTSNQLGYNQSSAQMDLQNALTAIGIDAANQSLMVQNTAAWQRGALGAAGDVLGIAGGRGAVSGLVGMGENLIGAAITMNQQTGQTGVNTAMQGSRNTANVANAGYIRDTNKDYADFAAKGDYAMAIGAINAKVQDAKLIQPTTSGQLGGEAFNLAAFRWALHAKIKRISPAALVSIGEYWLRYGYAVNRFATPPRSLAVMSHFTYWKMRETYLKAAAMPETYKQAIRGIFEKGVTVWTNPAFIGNIDTAINEPLEGVHL